MHLPKWKCANECQLLTIDKIEDVMYKGRSRGRRGGKWVGGGSRAGADLGGGGSRGSGPPFPI